MPYLPDGKWTALNWVGLFFVWKSGNQYLDLRDVMNVLILEELKA